MSSRRERIFQLIEWSVTHGLTPESLLWATKVSRYAASQWTSTEKTLKSYLKTLGKIYAQDRWRRVVFKSQNLTEQVKRSWFSKHDWPELNSRDAAEAHGISNDEKKRPAENHNYYSKSSNSYNGESIRKRVFDLWCQNPYITAKSACKSLGLNYEEKGNYVNKLFSEFRSYPKNGLPQAPHLPHKRIFVWECVVEDSEERMRFRKVALECGWKPPKGRQRNPFLVFRGVQGSVHWYKGGKVMLYLRGSLKLARAKELFGKAFSFLPIKMVVRYLDAPLREESRHWVFDVGHPLPRFDIRHFKRSHGIRIYTDGSHPTSIEVEETEPFWLKRFGEQVDKFSLAIQEHLNLIKEWRKEASQRQRNYNKVSSENALRCGHRKIRELKPLKASYDIYGEAASSIVASVDPGTNQGNRTKGKSVGVEGRD